MRESLKNIITALWSRLIGSSASTWMIHSLAKLAQLDLLELAYKKNGILKYENLLVSGEYKLIHRFLPELINNPNPVFFDVGAHQGDYSIELKKTFPRSCIYAFEPNPETYKRLSETIDKNLGKMGVHLFNFGLSDKTASQRLYSYGADRMAPSASLYQGVFLKSCKAEDLASIECDFLTLDSFCKTKSISEIDLLKLDVEGHEYACLQGGREFLREGRIRLIQFEFNEMNIESRIFLKDFYNLLKDYNFFRLDTDRLIPLNVHSPRYEIFQFQNILAVHKQAEINN